MRVTITTDQGEVLNTVKSDYTDKQLVQSTERRRYRQEFAEQVSEAIEDEWNAMCIRYEQAQKQQQEQRTESLKLQGGSNIQVIPTVREWHGRDSNNDE